MAVMQDAMADLQNTVRTVSKERGKIASGSTLDSMSALVLAYDDIQGATFGIVVILEANESWRFVGSGRGPGMLPPVQKIQAWIDLRGYDLSAWAIAKTHQKLGSKDYREGKQNVFLEATDKWQSDSQELVRAADALAEQMGDFAVLDIQRSLTT